MGQVIGKFYVATVTDRGPQDCYDMKQGESVKGMPQVAVRLQATTNKDGTVEDEAFYRSTPQGSIDMVIQNPDAAEQFQQGDQFYVRFERIPKA